MTSKALSQHFTTAVIMLLLAMLAIYLWPMDMADEQVAQSISHDVNQQSADNPFLLHDQPLLVKELAGIETEEKEPGTQANEAVYKSCKDEMVLEIQFIDSNFRASIAQEQTEELQRLLGSRLITYYDLYDTTSEEFQPFKQNYINKQLKRLTAEWQNTGDKFTATLVMERCLANLELKVCDDTLISNLLQAEAENGYFWLLASIMYSKQDKNEKLIDALENAYLASEWNSYRSEFMLRIYAEFMATANHQFYAFAESHATQMQRFMPPHDSLPICDDRDQAYNCYQLGLKLNSKDIDHRIKAFARNLQKNYLEIEGNQTGLNEILDEEKNYNDELIDIKRDTKFPYHPEFFSFLIQTAHIPDQLDAMKLVNAEAKRIINQYPDVCMLQ